MMNSIVPRQELNVIIVNTSNGKSEEFLLLWIQHDDDYEDEMIYFYLDNNGKIEWISSMDSTFKRLKRTKF